MYRIAYKGFADTGIAPIKITLFKNDFLYGNSTCYLMVKHSQYTPIH